MGLIHLKNKRRKEIKIVEQEVFFTNQITIAEDMWNSRCGIELITFDDNLWAYVISPESISKMEMLKDNRVYFKRVWESEDLAEEAAEHLRTLTKGKEIQYIEIFTGDGGYTSIYTTLSLLEYFRESLNISDEAVVRIRENTIDYVIEEDSIDKDDYNIDIFSALKENKPIYIYKADIADIEGDNTSEEFNNSLIEGLVLQHFNRVKTMTGAQYTGVGKYMHRFRTERQVSNNKTLRVLYNAFYKYNIEELFLDGFYNWSDKAEYFTQASLTFSDVLDKIAEREVEKLGDTNKILKRAAGISDNKRTISKVYTANSDDIYFTMQKKMIEILRQMWKDRVYLSVNIVEVLDIQSRMGYESVIDSLDINSIVTFEKDLDIDEYIDKLIESQLKL